MLNQTYRDDPGKELEDRFAKMRNLQRREN
jgi:hypothetical protein